MPFVENQGTKIYWDEQGQGEPLLLIMGLGYASALWHRTRPVLAQRYRTVAFDNRGVGLSDVPPAPYSIGPWQRTPLRCWMPPVLLVPTSSGFRWAA